MKTIKRSIAACAISLLSCLMTGCHVDGPDEILKEDNFLNEHMEEFESATSELTSLTVGQDQIDKSTVGALLNDLKKAGYVDKSDIYDDYVHVEYTNGLILDYPVIPNEIFVPESSIDDDIANVAQYTKAGNDNFEAYVFDGSEVGERKAQHSLVLGTWQYLGEMGVSRGYARGAEFTPDALEAAFRNSNIRYVIISSHGYSGLVVTGECVPAKQFKGISGEELKIAMRQNRLADIGTKRNGEHMYNRVWDPTYIINLPGAAEKLVYFTGCNIMTEFNKSQFNKFYNGIVAGWDGVNVIGEAVGFCLTDALFTKTFKTFMSECESITDYENNSQFTYAGMMNDFLLMPQSSSTYLPYSGKNSQITKPTQFQRVKPHLGVSAISFSFAYDKDEYNGASVNSKKGPKFILTVFDALDREMVYDASCIGTVSGKWFDKVLSDASGVFRITVKRSLDGGETYSVYQTRYAMISNDFEKNSVEGDDSDVPDVATFDIEQEDGSVILVGKSYKYKTIKQAGFSYCPVGGEEEKSIDGTGNTVFSATLTGLLPDTDYCAYAYVVDDSNERHAGNVVYFRSGDVQSATAEAVDLGLSVKWASCNLGASKPEEYGGYYQWGGLEDVTDTSIYLDWDNCPYGDGTKYDPSAKIVLDPEDDIAHVKLGGNWRMPTADEFQELIDNCIKEETTLNGVRGLNLTSKKNGNSIFLPIAGARSCDFIIGGSNPSKWIGMYWSSSLDTLSPSGGLALLWGDRDGVFQIAYSSRYQGLSVRPVSE